MLSKVNSDFQQTKLDEQPKNGFGSCIVPAMIPRKNEEFNGAFNC